MLQFAASALLDACRKPSADPTADWFRDHRTELETVREMLAADHGAVTSVKAFRSALSTEPGARTGVAAPGCAGAPSRGSVAVVAPPQTSARSKRSSASRPADSTRTHARFLQVEFHPASPANRQAASSSGLWIQIRLHAPGYRTSCGPRRYRHHHRTAGTDAPRRTTSRSAAAGTKKLASNQAERVPLSRTHVSATPRAREVVWAGVVAR